MFKRREKSCACFLFTMPRTCRLIVHPRKSESHFQCNVNQALGNSRGLRVWRRIPTNDSVIVDETGIFQFFSYGFQLVIYF